MKTPSALKKFLKIIRKQSTQTFLLFPQKETNKRNTENHLQIFSQKEYYQVIESGEKGI